MTTPPTPAYPPKAPARRALVRRIVTRTFWLGVVLAGLTVLWSLWYVSHRGFTRKWRQTLVEELAKRGVYMTVGRLTLNPLQGLVAKEVRLRDARERGRAVAAINEIILDINYSNLVHHEAFLNAVELRNATVSLPLNPEGHSKNSRLSVSKINARILLPPHQLQVERAEAEVHGLHVVLNGVLANPEKLKMPEKSNREAHPLRRVAEALDALDRLKLSGGEPELELRFAGDLAKPGGIFVEGLFKTGPFTVDGEARVESLRVAGRLVDGRVRVDQCEIKDPKGEFNATGDCELATGEASLQIRSTLDLPSFIHAIKPKSAINELVFYAPPKLEINATGKFLGSRGLSLYGRFSTGRFEARSLIFEGAEADFSIDAPDLTRENLRWYLHGVHIRHKNGAFSLNAMEVPGDFRFDLDSRINPAVFLPLLPAEAREALAEWDFRTPPVLHLEGRGTKCAPQAIEVTGTVQLGSTLARGTEIKRASTEVDFKQNVLTCRNIDLERAEGKGTGTVVYDFNTDELQFKNVHTTVNPVEVVRIFDHEIADDLLPYRFKNRPALVANGTVGCAHNDWARNHLRIEVNGAQGMDYTFLGKNLSASKITGVVNVEVDRLKLEHLDAELFGGHLRGDADISLRKAVGDYKAALTSEGVDFPSLTKLYFDFDTSRGKLNASFNFTGLHDWARAIDGTGSINITDGNVFAIPIFGPFSSILNFVFPGMGYNVARKGTCDFQMRDGVVSTDNLVMEGHGFSIFGKGKLFILEDRMDFFARINAQGLPGKVLTPVSHLLEYVSDGSLMNPAWRPRRLPKMIFPYHPPHPKPLPSASPGEGPGSSPASPGAGSSGNPGGKADASSPRPAASPSPSPVGAKPLWKEPWRAPMRILKQGLRTPLKLLPGSSAGASATPRSGS